MSGKALAHVYKGYAVANCLAVANEQVVTIWASESKCASGDYSSTSEQLSKW